MGSITIPYFVAWVALGVAVVVSLIDWLRMAARGLR